MAEKYVEFYDGSGVKPRRVRFGLANYDDDGWRGLKIRIYEYYGVDKNGEILWDGLTMEVDTTDVGRIIQMLDGHVNDIGYTTLAITNVKSSQDEKGDGYKTLRSCLRYDTEDGTPSIVFSIDRSDVTRRVLLNASQSLTLSWALKGALTTLCFGTGRV